MFALRDLRFLVSSLHFDVLRAQRIMGFFNLNYPQINEAAAKGELGNLKV